MVKFLLRNAFAFSREFIFSATIVVTTGLSGQLFAQCTESAFPDGSTVTPTADAGYGSLNVGPGTYIVSNVHNGGLYTFSTCGAAPAWGSNTYITGFTQGSAALFYNDDNGPICTSTLASVQWTATSTSQVDVQLNTSGCGGWQGGGAGNSALLQYRCDGPGNPAVFGSNTWNLYAFNDGDAAGNSGSWSTAYSGYMILGPSLSFNTQTFWANTGSPSDNGLFLGCTVLPDNHSWTAKRQGFPCGVYRIDVTDHDDRYDLLVNGILVSQHVGCCDSHIGAWTGTLTAGSTVEFRVSEGGGASSGAIQFTLVTPVLDGGQIATSQTICSGGDPAAFTSTTAASGGAGGYSYNWYYEDNCAPPAVFAGSGLTYDAPALTNTRCYYRIVTDACAVDDPSNAATVTVLADPAVSASGATTICAGGSATLTATPSGGTGCSTVTWESSVNGSTGWTATGLSGNSVSVSPGSSLYYRAVLACGGNGCNPNPATSSAVLVTVNPQATANAGLAQTVCQGSSVTLAGSVGGGASSGTWTAPSGTFSNASSLTSTYTPVIVSGPVTLTLTTDDPAGPCPAVSSNVVITVNAAATANAGFPQTVCQGGTINLSGSIGGSASAVTWSAPSGSFSNVNSLTSTYTPSISSGNVTLTLTTNDPDGAGPCTGAVSTVVITVDQAATANAGTAQTVCQGGTVTLAGSVGGGASSGTWSAGTGSFSNVNSLTSTYAPSISSGTVTLTLTSNDPDGGGPCPAATSTVVITVNPAATASAGFPQTVCQGGTVTLAGSIGGSASTVTWSAPSGSFSNINSLTSTYTPSIASGNVTLTLTTNDPDGAGPCSAAVSTVVITVDQAATANAGVAQTVCQGGTVTLAGSIGGSASSSTWSAGTGTFSNASSLTSTYTPSISSGTVTLTLTTNDPDAGGPCNPATSTVVITVNPAATVSAGFPQTVCEGGTINLAGSIGGSATSATWTAPSGTFSNASSLTSTYTPSISSGTVTLTLTTNDPDGAGPCVAAVSTVVITVNQAATANAGSSQTVCGGGTITLAGTIGGSATSSTWSAGSGTFSDATSLTSTYTPSISSGTVTLTLTTNDPDGGGPCSAATSTVVITVNQAPTANAGVPQTVCEGGTITLSGGIGGSATTSTWSAPSGAFSNVNSLGSTYTPSITSGTVTLTLTTNDPDGAGPCAPAVSTVVITVNQAATANAGTTQTVCQAGTVTLAGSIGGSATSSTWSAPTGTFSNVNSLTSTYSPSIVSGNVTLTLTTNDPDGVGPCQAATSTVVITVTPLPAINSVAHTDVLCFGGNTGTITVTASNGTPPLSYSIDNGTTFQSSNFFNNLIIGSYNVIVKDVQTCSVPYASNPVVVAQPALLDHTTTVTDASCANVFDGKIDVFASGGVAPYAYSLNGGPTQVGSQFTGLQSGSYVVYVFDANGCVDTSHVIINDSYNVSSFIVSQTNVSCYGGSDGAVTVQIIGGTPSFSYSINGSIFSASPTFTGLTAANYVVILRDSKGCTAFQPVNITQPAQLSAIIDVVNNVTCNSTATGEIFMTVNGGTTPYSYYWSNGDTNQDVSGLLAGTYTVTITDAKGCTTFSGATVTQPVALFVNIASYHDLKCFNDSSGSIDITVSGGIPAYTYIWSNGATTEDLTGLHAGTYTVTVSDNNLCQKIVTQTIAEPTLLSSTIVGSNVTCNGVNNGTVDLTVSGGTTPYTYLWSNATTNEDLTNVSAGTYSVVVTDAHGCVITNNTTVSQPAGLGLTTSITNVLCFGNATGAIDLTVSGGTPAYSYLWSNSSSNEDQTGLTAGTYSVIVTDANTCSASVSVTITQPAQALNGTLVATAVTCNGANNGSVNLTVTGGTQPYTFLWSNSAATEDISGLSGNTYSVVVTDANGCAFTGSATVNEPAPLTTTNEPTDVSCYGGNDGDIQLYPADGNPPYTFLWSTFATTQNITNLTAGTYTVIVTDSKGCQTISSITINQPAPLVITGTVTNVSCNGINNGAIDVTVTGGTGNSYSYSWDNSTSTEDQAALVAGTYSLTVTDDNGCTATATYTVTQPTPLTLSGTTTNVNCNGNANGTINITVTGGTTLYTYLWDDNTTTEDRSGLSGGTYDVTVTDAHLCTVSSSYTINEPAAIASSIVGTHVTCHGLSNGAADLTVSGGATPYTYLWSNFLNSEDLTNIAGGTYYVIITDANGCTKRDSVFIAEPAAITISVAAANVLCNGALTGAIDITVNGGTPTITYAWSNSATSEDLLGVAAGNFSVVINDGNGCTASATATITQPAALVLNATTTDVGCAGGANGSVDITVQGGVFPYTFAWSNSATTEDIHNVSGGTYSVVVTDANGCTLTASYTINEPSPMITSVAGTNVTCYGANNGAADLTVSGGTSPYSYLWSNFLNTQDLTNISGGTYYVIITDANNCTKRDSVIITEPTAIVLSITSVNVSCNGASNGSIDLTVTGGVTGYTYLWSNSATTEDISGLIAGTYSVVVTDGNSCTASVSVTITQPASAISATAVATDVTCNGANNGSVNLTVLGGTQPYTFLWSNSATTEDITGVGAGTYTVGITDANGCTFSASATVNEPQPLVASIQGTNVSCFGGNDGAADLTVTGGNIPYTYLWSTFSTTEDLSSLTAGNYVVIVTDSKACQTITSVTITQPTKVTVTGTVVNLSCNGAGDGFIDITASGGTGGYTYGWSNSTSSEDQSNIVAGTYTVTVYDANLCTATATFIVTEPAALVLTGTQTNVSCNGASTGSINITITGGTTPYTYSWSNGAVTEDISSLPAGPYSIVVTDANLCSVSAFYIITEPAPIVSSVAGTDVICHGANNGAADLTVSGGATPYTYLWSNFINTQDLSNLGGSTYYVIITDANGCTKRDSVIIAEPAAIVTSTIVTNVLCNGGITGAVDLTVSGGTPGYTFLWSNSATSEDLSGVTAGIYTVVITDGNSCTASASATVTQPTALVLNSTVTNVLCAGGASGSVDITVQGGVFPYIYAWSNSATTEDIHNVSGGNYSVIVTDANGCTISASFTVSEPTALVATTTGVDVTCHGANNGSVDLTVSGGVPGYTYIWTNGATTEDLSGLAGGTYTVVVHDANGCSAVASQVIAEPSAIITSVVVTNVLCNGGTTGAVDLTVSGGTLGYTFLWNNSATTEDLSGVTAGTYTLVITDGNVCTASASATVTQPTALVLNSTITNVLCAGGASGSVDITVQGGVFPYTYAWSNSATTEDIHNVSGGNYSVIVTDANGCTISASFTVSEPTALVATTTGVDVTCHGANNGSVDLTVSGGVPGYTYIWTNGATTEDLSGLAGGTYTVVVHDANGCSAVASQTIAEPSAIVTSVVVTDVLCNGETNGAVDLTFSGGTPGYTFLWSNSATTEDLTGVAAGTYTVVITDGNGCTISASATVAQPTALVISGNKTDVSCNGGNNGTINITVSGGVIPYSYAWSNGAVIEDLGGLVANTYTVTATDANGCTVTASFTISEPVALLAATTGVNVTCHGANNGSVDLTVSGGTPGYTYVWTNGAITEDLTGLAGGTYTVVVHDANGCSAVGSQVITEPSAIVTSTVVTNILCNGNSTGAVDLTVSGGTPGYIFLWSNSATTEDLSGVIAGTYNVVITDGNGCTASASATVAQPTALVISGNKTDVSCNGGNNGTINISVSGGVTPYTYVWSNGALIEDLGGLVANTYTVTATDANGCTVTASFIISEPSALIASTTGTNVLCHGANTGAVDLTVSGGTPGYSYVWTNGAITEDLTGLAGGTYTVVVHDANGCSAVGSQVITEPSALVTSVVVTNVLCNGGTGSVDLTVTGGTPAYTYLWSNGATTEDLSGVTAGTYTVVITDGNGCTASASATVTQPTALLLTGAKTDVSCNGGSNGTVNISVSGGVIPYTYAWSNGSLLEDLAGLVANTYTITATDANGCTVTASFTISEPTAITSLVTGTDVTCHGVANGTADLTVNGGVTPYSFAWSNFHVSEDLTNLSGGTYFVIITDANGCNHRDSIIINEPSALVLTVTSTTISCNGGGANIDLTVTGGTPSYSYLWSTTDITEDLTGVAAGLYTVTVTDANGCTASAIATVIQPVALLVGGSATDVHCAGGNDGTVNISVGGGTSPYTYIWSNSAITEDIQNLTIGTYSVTVTDLNGCSASASFTVAEPTGIISSIAGTNVTCHGAGNGAADLTVSGGTLPYNFFWSNFQGIEDIQGLDGGTYYVLITDGNGCLHRDSIIINEPSQIVITVDSAYDISCYNNTDGRIYITVTGGTPAYGFLWSNSAVTEDIAGLTDGLYVVTVTDANSCQESKSVNIARPSRLTLNAVIQRPTCYTLTDGKIDLIPTGGTPTYHFFWTDSATGTRIGNDFTEDPTGIGAGTYIVVITDVNLCSAIDTILVTEPGAFYISDFYRNPSCHNFQDGYVDVTAYGGTLPYSFTWNDASSTEDKYNIGGGVYNVTALDANGCMAVFGQTLIDPAPLVVTASATSITCFGTNGGTLTGSATGGTEPYYYFWSTFDTTKNLTNIMAGHYVLQVTDSNGCFNSDTADITQPNALAFNANITNETCFGGSTGGVDITVTGGTPAYTYLWSNTTVSEDLVNLVAGTYTVTVTDAVICTVTGSFVITEPTQIYLSMLTNQPSCHGSTNGSISVVASQGVPGYSYAWNTTPAQNTASAAALPAGDYTVTVTDSKSCTVTATQTLAQPAEIVVVAADTASKCFNTANGKVVITATGGLEPYIYELNGLTQLTNTFNNVGVGNYLVIVTDLNGCEGTDTFSIIPANQIAVSLTTSQQVVLTGMETQLFTSVTPAQTITNIMWSPQLDSTYGSIFNFNGCDSTNCPSPMVHPRYTTTFTVTVMNTDGCLASDTLTIDVLNEASKFIPTAFSPNGDGLNDRFEFDVLGADKLDVSIYNRWGEMVFHNDSQINGMSGGSGWDGSKNGKLCPYDTYVYKIKIKYFDGSVVDVNGTVTLMK